MSGGQRASRAVIELDRAGDLGRSLIGGKAAGLATMIGLGLRVPPGFVVTVPAARAVAEGGGLEGDLASEVDAALARLAVRCGSVRVAVRSGAAVSMPGMLDTVLDVDPVPARVGEAIVDVARSWHSPRARAYRDLHGIDHELGTAVVVQAMVRGDRDERSGSGVAFSRDPRTGEPGLCGDYLPGARGDAVVGGGRAVLPLTDLATLVPEAWDELVVAVAAIEARLRDLVDVELTVESGRLHLLQCRVGARAAAAAVRVAVDLVDEGVLSPAEAAARVTPAQRDLAARPTVDARAAGLPIAQGLGASPGVVCGVVCTSPDRLLDARPDGPVVLVRDETSPTDVAAMAAADGLLTRLGGLVSHAAIVARELDLPAVVGAVDLDVADGDVITIDGVTGAVWRGEVPVLAPVPDAYLARLAAWPA